METAKTGLSEEDELTLKLLLSKRRYNIWRVYGSHRLLLISSKPKEPKVEAATTENSCQKAT